MASWNEFATAAPALAALGRERFDSTELVLMGTTRKDGSPRVTPIEFFFFEGELTLGGMWQSRKLVDVLRDPRCVLHSTVTNKSGTEGDFKLAGRAAPIDGPDERARYARALRAATGWAPEEPFHLFQLDILEAAYVVFGTAVKAALERLAGTPGVDARILPNTEEGYLVATWKAAAG